MYSNFALVIEDDFDAAYIFASALEAIGFTTEIIESGNDAIERLSEVIPEVIVLDLHLPEVSGPSILEFIRQNEFLDETKVIIATADPRLADLMRDKADIVLIKPTTYSQIRDFAKRLTGGCVSG